MDTLTRVALAQPWMALAVLTAVFSPVARIVRAAGRRGRRPAPATTMAWRGTAPGSGWRPDPSGRHTHRYHDGAGWTVLVVGRDGRARCHAWDDAAPVTTSDGTTVARSAARR
jgi:hypothetical protein